MNMITARLISFVFHPLLMATYLFGLLSFELPMALFPIQSTGHQWFVLIIFITSFFLPAFSIGIFKMLGSIKSLTMDNRSERFVPFSLITIFYFMFTYMFYYKFKIGPSDNVFKMMLIVDGLVLASTLVTYFYKLSIHSVAICGLLGIIIPLNKVAEHNQLLLPTIVLILLAGIIMSSRLRLNVHTPREVLIGSLTGLMTGFLGMMILF